MTLANIVLMNYYFHFKKYICSVKGEKKIKKEVKALIILVGRHDFERILA
jgi:hypothetical protein